MSEVRRKPDGAGKVATLLAARREAKERDGGHPLLALRRRAVLGAQTPGAAETVARLLGDPSPEVREVAARSLA